jgi:hypothetical protein
MFNNELEEDLVAGKVEFKGFDLPRTIPNFNSFNHLSVSMFCKAMSKYNDVALHYPEFIIDFEGLHKEGLPFKQFCSVILFEAFNIFLKDPNVDISELALYIDNTEKLKIFNMKESEIKYLSTLYMSFVSCIKNLKDEILNSAGFISKEKIYFSYGRNPRECYQQYIDLITVKEEGINVFILTPQVFGARNNSRTVSNPRVLHIINHFNDLGLNLLNVYEITIPFSEGNSVSLQRIPINKVNVQSAINFCRADPTFTSNLIFCRTCKYNNSCSIKDMIPIYRV